MTITRRAAVANALRDQINAGVYPPGSHLPSAAELTTTHRVSRATVLDALSDLVGEGLITTHSGKPAQVADYHRMTWDAQRYYPANGCVPADGWYASIRANGDDPIETIRCEILSADPTVATLLSVPVGTEVVVRRRIRRAYRPDGTHTVHSIADSYYPRHLVRNTVIELPVEIGSGVVSILRALGHNEVEVEDQWIGRPATPGEADILGLRAGAPVLAGIRRSLTSTGAVTRCTSQVFPGASTVARYTYPLAAIRGDTVTTATATCYRVASGTTHENLRRPIDGLGRLATIRNDLEGIDFTDTFTLAYVDEAWTVQEPAGPLDPTHTYRLVSASTGEPVFSLLAAPLVEGALPRFDPLTLDESRVYRMVRDEAGFTLTVV